MPSSKFNKKPPPKKKPSICIAPAGSCLPLFDERRPPNLFAWVHWRDLDPLSPMDAGDVFTTDPRTGGGTYTGHVHIDQVTLGIIVWDHWPSPTVDVQIFYEDPFWGYQTYNFPTVDMPIDEPFNTRRLTTIFIPGRDFRSAWANG